MWDVCGDGLGYWFLVGGNDALIGLERFPPPNARKEIEDFVRLGCEFGIPGKDPTAVVPGAKGILVKPSPDGAACC
jgi:hypothetical protein